jgi:hypothetical protein
LLDKVEKHIQRKHHNGKLVCSDVKYGDYFPGSVTTTTGTTTASSSSVTSVTASIIATADVDDIEADTNNSHVLDTVTTSSGVTDSDNALDTDSADDNAAADTFFDDAVADASNDTMPDAFVVDRDDTTAAAADDDSGEASDSESAIAGGGEDSSDPDYNNSDIDREFALRPSSRGRQTRVRLRHSHSPYPSRSHSESSSPHRQGSRPSAPRRLSTDFLSPSLANLHLQPPSRAHSPTPIAPSPLAQVAFSRANSNSPSQSSSSSSETQEEETPMDIDPPPPVEAPLDPPLDNVLLNLASLRAIPLSYLNVTPTLLLVVCNTCQIGLCPGSALSHAVSTHKIPLKKDQKKSIQAVLSKPSMIKKPGKAIPPTYPCPPVDGLAQKKGIICSVCHYCCIAKNSIRNHFSKHHRGTDHSVNADSKTVTIQAFSSQNRKYFPVIPVLSGMSQGNLFTVYLEQHAPHIDSLHLINPPLDHNEVPPFLKITQWREHLASFIDGDKNNVRKLLDLTQAPTHGSSWLRTPLRKTIEAYMKDAAHKANSSILGIRCILMGPRSAS